MAIHSLSNHFDYFFSRINPSLSFEAIASRQYNNIKNLIEDRSGPASVLSPVCFLQGSYRHDTSIHSINDVDIIVMCDLKYPGSGNGRGWSRNEIFDTIAAALHKDPQYKDKIYYNKNSMCIKIYLGIKVEILPVVYAAQSYRDRDVEPFYLFRPESKRWEPGYAKYHKSHLSIKNSFDTTQENFIPSIKVLKHINTIHGTSSVSFHIESLLHALPHSIFYGSPADYLEGIFSHIASASATEWYKLQVYTPCGDRDIFTGSEWTFANWEIFHKKIEQCASVAILANQSAEKQRAIELWQAILGKDYFPLEVGV